jgi:dihydrolipoamide dehydrogenase
MRAKKDFLVRSLKEALTRRLRQLGVRVLKGRARLTGPRAALVETEGGAREVPFEAAILATGSQAWFPPPFDRLRERVFDSDRILDIPRPPKRIAIVGGGAVGCEFACLFRELGSAVTLVEITDQLLPGEDPLVARTLKAAFEKRGMAVLTETSVRDAAPKGAGWVLELSPGGPLRTDRVLVCAGRKPFLDGLGLEEAGVLVRDGRLTVNEFMQTSQPHIYAVGDVNGLSLLAHAAAAQGEAAVDHLFGGGRPYDGRFVPRCLYTWPEVASVGAWAEDLKAGGRDTKTRRFFFQGSPKALAAGEGEGFIQVVSEPGEGRVLGAQIIGPHASELIHVFSVALAAEMTVGALKGVIFAHPTLAEGVREALSR